ncbi:hypothetical protein [Acholeplasma hippikon]|uniref:Uncharacterized protein n=1 Tax=Acholeplasma hippikon TaxID=264636 RepID=A0A449BLL7_9MOLU|nr:hypothetical protein [Acholeplasma hippikon]VEU83335.1 Uncharacterised protein [Acholeplasma hippikon]
MKKRLILFSLIFILFITSTYIGAVLTSQGNKDDDFEVGFVKVDLNAYFEKNNIIYDKDDGIEAILHQGGETIVKKGVYALNITDSNHVQFIENFRVKFNVSSNVDTYFRVRFLESKILRTVNSQGQITEYVLIGGFPLNITNDFYLHTDGYYYYKNRVQRVDQDTKREITFIGSYFPGQSFATAPVGQELQVTFKIEAVQAVGGPVENWRLLTPPWGGNW